MQTQALRTPFAVRHTALPEPTTTTRVGALVWWKFQNSAGNFADLADAALQAKFPTLFLPLLHPVSETVAFNRMTRAAERVLEGKRWRGDTVDRAGLAGGAVPPEEVTDWSTQFEPAALIAAVQTWEPLERPWHVRLWICLRQDPVSRYLPTMEVTRFFMVIETTPKGTLDITDHVVKAATATDESQVAAEEKALVAEVLHNLGVKSPPDSMPNEALRVGGNLTMGRHLYRVLNRERTLATSSEIGDGVNEALEEVGGVKLRPGLFVVPGETGVERGQAALEYIEAIPNTDAGMFDLYERKNASGAAGLIRPILEGEAGRLRQDITDLEIGDVGVQALRTWWRRLEAQQKWLDLNNELLGPAGAKLMTSLEEVRTVFLDKVNRKATMPGKEIDLDPEPTTAARAHLEDGLEGIRALAEGGDVVEKLTAANSELGGGQSAMRSMRCALLLRRLRKLAAATLHVSRDRSHGSVDDARQRTQVLRRALGVAVDYIRENHPL